ncbi:MAG: histidine kinase dimerization/phospho-acceptor domain-containing protein, partial [Eubacterium sp.]
FGRQINTLRENLLGEIDAAVEKELKSERLKTELITNVSHDIRTPLTSIIAYVDILKSPNISEEDRQKYICILDEKANRLKNLTDDLFEAAKASTGNIDIQLDVVNPEALVDQALGEFEEKLKAAELQIIMTRPEEKILVQADGRQFWRVIENLLTNVVKYALKGSRVYIDIRRENHEGILEVKNISAQALGIPAEELMERFKRGDGARHTEGSGLGLAITRDLTELQGGHFEIAIDGDLFKALVWMPVADQKE